MGIFDIFRPKPPNPKGNLTSREASEASEAASRYREAMQYSSSLAEEAERKARLEAEIESGYTGEPPNTPEVDTTRMTEEEWLTYMATKRGLGEGPVVGTGSKPKGSTWWSEESARKQAEIDRLRKEAEDLKQRAAEAEAKSKSSTSSGKTSWSKSFKEERQAWAKNNPDNPDPGDAFWQEKAARRKAEAFRQAWAEFGPDQGPSETDEDYKERILGADQKGTKWTTKDRDEDLLSKLSPKDRIKYEKILKEKAAEEAKARLMGKATGIDFEPDWTYEKQWVPGFTVPAGATEGYTDPRTKAHYKAGEYVPGHHEMIKLVGKKPSASEIRIKALQTEADLGMAEDVMKNYRFSKTKRAKALKATGIAAQAGLGAAKFIGGVSVSGVQGIAMGMQPTRGAGSRAQRIHTPNVDPTSIYAVGRHEINLSGVKRLSTPGRGINPGEGIDVLKGATMPRINTRLNLTKTGLPGSTPASIKVKKWRLF